MRDFIGWSCWVIGFLLQCSADFTKLNWNSNPANHGKWIDVGIWYYFFLIFFDLFLFIFIYFFFYFFFF